MQRSAPSRGKRSPPPLRVLLADDEPLALRRLRRLLAGERDVQVVDECSEGRAAAESIRRQAPYLVFLDIQIPELDAFQVLESLATDQLPVVRFATAYDYHAFHLLD